MAKNILRLDELNQLPRNLQLDRIDEGEGPEAALVANKARWHQSCRLAINNTEVKRAEKRASKETTYVDVNETITELNKRPRRRTSSIEEATMEPICFFCNKPAGDEILHEAATFQLDNTVRKCC